MDVSFVASEPTQGSGSPRLRADVNDLRASTSQMLERWRTRTDQSRPKDGCEPDMTLVDIFKSEDEVAAREDPLSAVMEILKAPADVVAATPRA
jgi:hypothetical protein